MYRSIVDLETRGVVQVNPRLKDLLTAESTKNRSNNKIFNSLPLRLREAAKRIKTNPNIIVRKADKSSTFVILDKDDYLDKVNHILNDTSKFLRINKDPSNGIKTEANKLITTLNSVENNLKLNKIVGDYNLGYLYGNVKTHKQGNPLRPIISQCPTSTYHLAKSLNKIILPYIDNKYMLTSTDDFLDLVKSNDYQGIIASLDVESLFSNVPIDTTINIIIERTYHHPNLLPPRIPPEILRKMLILCTKELAFTTPNGHIFKQIDGVAMGSPLGPTFANYYMSHLENTIFSNCPNVKPTLYARYVDDIFLVVNDETEIVNMKNNFESHSILKFTYEMNINGKLPFLDVLVEMNNGVIRTNVYRKNTNTGHCLNADSHCSQQYKESVIKSYINRAYKVTDSWNDFHEEIKTVKQMLVNNNFSNSIIDRNINEFLSNKFTSNELNDKSYINIYYKNQYHENYRMEEKSIHNIVKSNIKCVDENKKIRFIIYYKNKKTASLIMINNNAPRPTDMQKANVVYKFQCPLSHGNATSTYDYVGMTTTCLLRRLTSHTYSGSIKEHFVEHHNMKMDKSMLVNNTVIIDTASDRLRLQVKEAIHIQNLRPNINKQTDLFQTSILLYRNVSPNLSSTRVARAQRFVTFPVSPGIRERINSLVNSARNRESTVLH